MGFLAVIGDAIWAKLEPHLTARLDQLQADTLAMLSEALPEMAGKIAEQAVLTTFANTQVDEAADAVSGVITDIVNRLPRFPFMLGGK